MIVRASNNFKELDIYIYRYITIVILVFVSIFNSITFKYIPTLKSWLHHHPETSYLNHQIPGSTIVRFIVDIIKFQGDKFFSFLISINFLCELEIFSRYIYIFFISKIGKIVLSNEEDNKITQTVHLSCP